MQVTAQCWSNCPRLKINPLFIFKLYIHAFLTADRLVTTLAEEIVICCSYLI